MGFNTPLPLPLRDECRKASKIVRSFVDTQNNGLDKVIPRYVIEQAAGFAIFTVAKAGFLLSARAGSGVVIARLEDGSWSPPSGIAVGGMGFGGQAGAEVTDFLIVLNSRAAVATFMSAGSLTLGGNLSVAVGPIGRNAEGSGALNTKGKMAAMYSYSKTKGLFGGMSVEGTVIAERQDANRLAYGGNPTSKQILTGAFEPPEWADVLIDALETATGIPGGHQWVQDPPTETGAMGWSSPGRNGGYAFGEGVGAGGTATSRKRSSSLFSLGGSKDRGGGTPTSMFNRDGTSPRNSGRSSPATSIAPASTPSRPWEMRRASTFLPTMTSPMKLGAKPRERRATGPSSESYNADYDQYAAAQRKDGPRRPYELKATPSPFASDLDSRNGSPRSTPPRSTPASLHSPKTEGGFNWDRTTPTKPLPPSRQRSASNSRDLLGSWDADTAGLSANFATLSTNGNGTSSSTPRSRKSSTLPPFDETAEVFTERKNGHSDIFTEDVSRSKASTPPKPQLSVRPGLESDGHAKAIAIFEFKGGQEGDLAFKKGQVLTVLSAVGDGEWWKGRAVGGGGASGEGIFPANYVEVLDIPKDLKGMSRSLLRSRVLGLDDFE